jgi:hypothetical protein
VIERGQYKGWQDISQETFNGYTNYNALNVSVQRRLSNGLLLGLAYTFSKALGVTAFDPLVPNNDARNYGPESTDRRHNLLINYSYDLPDPGKALNNKFLGFALDNWTFSGLTTFQTGAPINPTFSGGNTDGSESETSRANYSGGAKNLSSINSGSCTGWGKAAANVHYVFNPCAFTPATQDAAWDPTANGGQGGVVATPCTATCLGTAGVGQFYGDGLNNFDLTLEKKFPLGSDSRRAFRVQFQAYNAFNHPQFITVDSSATFTATMCNASGTTCGNSSPLLIASEKPNSPKFGQATGDTGYRILSLNVRFEF